VAIIPISTFTVSLELSRRCSSGSRRLSNRPSTAPPKMHPTLIKKIIMRLCQLSHALSRLKIGNERFAKCAHPASANAEINQEVRVLIMLKCI